MRRSVTLHRGVSYARQEQDILSPDAESAPTSAASRHVHVDHIGVRAACGNVGVRRARRVGSSDGAGAALGSVGVRYQAPAESV